MQAKAAKEAAEKAIAEAKLTIDQHKALAGLYKKAQQMGLSKYRLIQKTLESHSPLPWNKRPYNLDGNNKGAYELFLPGEMRIRYVQFKNGNKYRVYKDAQGEFFQHKPNGKKMRVKQGKHKVYEASTELVYTRYDHPVVVGKGGGIYYQGKNTKTHITKARRKNIRNKLVIKRIK